MKNGACEFGSTLKVERIIFGRLRVLKKSKDFMNLWRSLISTKKKSLQNLKSIESRTKEKQANDENIPRHGRVPEH